MGGRKVPGFLGKDDICVCHIDSGTRSVTLNRSPGVIGCDVDVSRMPLEDRFVQVLYLTGPRLPGEIRQEFMNMLTPTNLAIMAGVLAVWAASHYFGVGFIVDAIMLIGGAILIGWQIITAAGDLVDSLATTYYAQDRCDLEKAADFLANFIAVVGVAVFMALIAKGAKGAKGSKGGGTPQSRGGSRGAGQQPSPPGPPASSQGRNGRPLTTTAAVALTSSDGARRAGMTVQHFEAFIQVASNMKKMIAVRYTNLKSLQWIERGFPAKPMAIKAKTKGSDWGIVRINQLDEAKKLKETREALDAGYLIVEGDGVARGLGGKTLDLRGRADWPVETGQVIHPTQNKPLVGDYDLLAVIDPGAPGRNISLATKGGEAVANRTNPLIDTVRGALNRVMGEERVMHGSHDTFGDLKSAISDPGDGAVVFFSDGTWRLMDTLEDVADFYRQIGRQTVQGRYNSVTPGRYDPSPR